eukprot:COSAG01_NODE_69238_length_262_cov_0.509202_1_plen_36_part_00
MVVVVCVDVWVGGGMGGGGVVVGGWGAAARVCGFF